MGSGNNRIKKGEKITVEFLPAINPHGLKPEQINDLVKQQIVKAMKTKST
jgi:hypothetical protein